MRSTLKSVVNSKTSFLSALLPLLTPASSASHDAQKLRMDAEFSPDLFGKKKHDTDYNPLLLLVAKIFHLGEKDHEEYFLVAVAKKRRPCNISHHSEIAVFDKDLSAFNAIVL